LREEWNAVAVLYLLHAANALFRVLKVQNEMLSTLSLMSGRMVE
jgi:hypothetical protein